MNNKPETERKLNKPDEPKGQKRRDQALEIIATAVLALATIATAWSGYKAARWSGLHSTLYSEAIALRFDSVRASSSAARFKQIDLVLFTNWLHSFASGDQNLAGFFEQRFRPEIKLVFKKWVATDPRNNPNTPHGPFAMPEYHINLSDEATELEDLAESTFKQGKGANLVSGQYIFNTILLASALFLAGITSRLNWFHARVAITIVAFNILLYGLYNNAVQPIF